MLRKKLGSRVLLASSLALVILGSITSAPARKALRHASSGAGNDKRLLRLRPERGRCLRQ